MNNTTTLSLSNHVHGFLAGKTTEACRDFLTHWTLDSVGNSKITIVRVTRWFFKWQKAYLHHRVHGAAECNRFASLEKFDHGGGTTVVVRPDSFHCYTVGYSQFWSAFIIKCQAGLTGPLAQITILSFSEICHSEFVLCSRRWCEEKNPKTFLLLESAKPYLLTCSAWRLLVSFLVEEKTLRSDASLAVKFNDVAVTRGYCRDDFWSSIVQSLESFLRWHPIQ